MEKNTATPHPKRTAAPALSVNALSDCPMNGLGLESLASSASPGVATTDADLAGIVPLGLLSAEDTLRLLTKERNPERAKAYRRDAARDLKWAMAEIQEGAYREQSAALILRVQSVKRALEEARVPTQAPSSPS
jgi:hypothetical protein